MSPIARQGDIELHYEVEGDRDGEPMLLIAGHGQQLIDWPDELLAQLHDLGYRTLRFDNRDAGRSTVLDAPPPDLIELARGRGDPPYGLDDLALDALAVLDACAVPAAHVVGASLGAMVGQLLAIRWPDRVLSLASISSTTGAADVGRAAPEVERALAARAAGGATPELRQRLGDRVADPLAVAVATSLLWASTDLGVTEADVAARLARRRARALAPGGAARQLAAVLAASDRTADLRRVTVPTVVIHGAKDPLIGLDGGEATAAAISGSELVVIRGMAHDLPTAAMRTIVAAIHRNARLGSSAKDW